MNGEPPNPSGSESSRHAPLSEFEKNLIATRVAPIGSRWRNWKLEGSGSNPFIVYGIFVGIILLWLLGACILSLLGPIAALLAVAALFAVVGYYSKRAALREMRTGMGLCPVCGYDLRATESACPECNTPVPEDILRRRRLVVEMRPGLVKKAAALNPPDLIDPLPALPAPLARPPAPELPPIPLVEMPEDKLGDDSVDDHASGPESNQET